ncbi:MAG: carboxypeptidase-like regulatory domain-containing protein [Planctomycetota bacterium]|nr:carboxypeptidase-like regulatory domain-containing protein [Planctomycetota bacterium]
MRAVAVGLVGGAILVLLLWWLGFGEPDPDEGFEVETATEAPEDTDEPDAATLEGRATGTENVTRTVELTGTAIVRAQVVDADAKPMAGVQVELRLQKRHDRFHWRPSTHAAEQFKPPVDLELIDSRLSQEDGWVEFRGLDVRGGYQLRALPEPPFFSAQATIYPGHTSVPPVLMLDKGVPLRVRVVDAEGKGLKAWVSGGIRKEPDHRGWNELTTWHLPRTPTTGDGRLGLPAVPETVLSFNVFVPGRGSRNGIELAPPFDEEILLPFEHAGGPVIRGRVSDSSGQPVANARLIANLNPKGAHDWQSRYTRVAQSGGDGTYRITGLPAGYLTGLSVHAEGYIYVQSAAPMMDVTDGQDVAIDVTLYRGGILEGTVRDPEGKPIPSARVVAALPNQHYWNNRGTTAVADESGHYRIEDVPLGKGHVGAYADGFYMPVPEGVKVQSWQMPPGALYEVKEEGQRLTRDVQLERGVRVEGQVVDESEAPVVGARVWASGNLQQRLYAFDQYATQRVTDAEGRFEYLGLAPGDVWRFGANTSEGHAKQVSVTLAAGKEQEPIKLVFQTKGAIRGKVDAGSRRLTRPIAVSIRRKQGGGSYSTSTRADGGFEQKNLAAGTYDVYASDGLGRRVGTAVTVEVVDGKVTDDVKIAVEPLAHVMGRVVDLDGEAVPGVQVKLYYKNARGGNQTNSTNTRADGRFAWRDLIDGDYEVRIAEEKTRYGVRPGEEEQKYVYVMPPKEFVEGTVVDPEGRPVAGGSVSIRRVRKPGNWNGSGAQIVNGRFRGEAPRGDGHIDVAVDNALDAFGRKLNTLPYLYEAWTPGSGPLQIKLEKGYKIAGQVRGPDGKPMPHVGIHIQQERRDGRKWYGYYYRNYHTNLRTGEDGRFEQLGLKEGRYEVYAQPGDKYMQPEPVSTEAGAENVVVRIEAGLTIQGRVVCPEGQPIVGANINYSWSIKDERGRNRNRNRSAKTDADGAFTVGGLPADAVGTLRATPASGGEKSYIAQSVSRVSAGESNVTVTLEGGGYIEGRVLGPGGEGVGRVRVRAEVHNGTRWQRRHSARTSNDGSYKLGPVPPGVYRLRVEAKGSYSASEPIEVRGPASDIVLEMPLGLPIKGQLLGDNVKGFHATWYAPKPNGGWTSKGSGVKNDGSFFINQGSEEAGMLLVRKNGDSRYALLEDVRPSDGPFEIELIQGDSIRGFVTGLPQSWRWANVYARNDRGISIWGRVNRDGTFVIHGVPPGTYTITGHMRPGRIGSKQSVAAGATDVELAYSR